MIILDSNVWIAFLNQSDSQHKKAVSIFDALEIHREGILLPEYVFIETVNVLQLKVGKTLSDRFIDRVLNVERVDFRFSSKVFVLDLIDFYLSNRHEKLSFVDQSLLFLSSEYSVVTFDQALKKLLKHNFSR